MASLALIGGFDPRPRLGAVLMDGGVVKKIDKKGKLVVQLTEHRETRKVSMMSLFSNYYIPRLEPDINFQVYFINYNLLLFGGVFRRIITPGNFYFVKSCTKFFFLPVTMLRNFFWRFNVSKCVLKCSSSFIKQLDSSQNSTTQKTNTELGSKNMSLLDRQVNNFIRFFSLTCLRVTRMPFASQRHSLDWFLKTSGLTRWRRSYIPVDFARKCLLQSFL